MEEFEKGVRRGGEGEKFWRESHAKEVDHVGVSGNETWSHSRGSPFARQWPEEQALLPGRTDVMGREECVCLQAN